MSTIYLWNPEPDNDCGAFSDEQLNERDETIEVCPDCLELLSDCECKYFSPCCGADMRTGNGDASYKDYGICPECKEHI
jgi:hypothetical protein